MLVKLILVGVITLAIVGGVYQSFATYSDKKAFRPSGEFVDVGGVQLYTEQSGSGNVTVVFESGMGDDLSVWHRVAADVSSFATVITYDRAGLGWSEKSQSVRDAQTIAAELHALLTQLDVGGPIILVGHSMGGITMQYYALSYSDKVAGLVLVDSAHERQIKDMPSPSLIQKAVVRAGMWAAPLGLPRLYLSNKNPEEKAKKSTTKHQYTSLDEAALFPESLAQLASLHPQFNALPVVVLARGVPSVELKPEQKREHSWALLQEDIAGRSSESTVIFTREKQHGIHKFQPDLVVDAIETLVASIESETTPTQ